MLFNGHELKHGVVLRASRSDYNLMTSKDWKPPTRDGVGASSVVTPEGTWPTFLAFLSERFAAIPSDQWVQRITSGNVLNDLGEPITANTPFRANTKVHYYRNLPVEPTIPFIEAILHRDEHLLVVDKPHFLPVSPVGQYVQETLLVRLKRSLHIETLAPLHRIDRETAGIVLFSVQPDTRDAYAALFRHRKVTKEYEAIAPTRADLFLPLRYRSRLVQSESFMQMREATGTPNSETHIELLATKGQLGRYRLSPVTGKKHQLRAHLAALGIPICNDRLYPDIRLSSRDASDFSQPLQLLAKAIGFVDPLTQVPRHFKSKRELLWKP
jgi:tRNA pseudouridine32 synthase / 23S rRNA pseudouridine746 synthase